LAITLIFLNQGFLIQPETLSALRRIPFIRTVCLDIISHPTVEQASLLITILQEQKCGILFTTNEWGIDSDGVIHQFLEKNKILHINWFVDDPFYEEIILKKKFHPSSYRIDFVSDKDYLQRMKNCGYNAFFLPLATDLSIFYPQAIECAHDAVFVGNSYLAQMDELLIDTDELIIPLTSFLVSMIKTYNHDNNTDLEASIIKHLSQSKIPDQIPFEKAVFITKHFIGYMYRKQIVTGLVNKLSGFTVVGDNGWKKMTDPQRVIKVGYYSGLRELYNSSRINIDINRMVIKNGFTQRTFDSLACKCFCITSSKPIVHEFFETTGDNKELVTFRNAEELQDLVRYYLVHEKQRNDIVERGYQKVISCHTYDHRVAEIFNVISQFLA
jgi:spore maturation protein CgeB